MKIFWMWRTDLRFRNKTHYQRLLHIARVYEVILIVPKSVYVTGEIGKTVSELVRCPWEMRGFANHVLFFFYGFWIFLKRRKDIKIVYSPPCYTILLFALVKRLWPQVYWMADMWDDPRLYIYLEGKYLLKKWGAWLFNRLVQHVLKLSDLVITVGTTLYEHLPRVMIEDFSIAPSKILTITNGVDLQMFNPKNIASERKKENDFRLLYIGYITEYTGVGILLGALRKTLSKISNVRLILVGFATERDECWLKQIIDTYNLHNHVDFRGIVPSENIPQIIGMSHVCIYPFPYHKDLDNVYPIKVYEYLAMGKPVIATALSGVQTIISDGYNGLIVIPGDEEDLSNGIWHLYHDNSLRQKLGKNARSSVEKYDWTSVNKPIIKYIASLT